MSNSHMAKRPYPFRKLARKLRREFGILCDKGRGKGSERMFYKPREPGTKKGPQHTIKCHGEGDEISILVIKAILERFGIPPEEFWD